MFVIKNIELQTTIYVNL